MQGIKNKVISVNGKLQIQTDNQTISPMAFASLVHTNKLPDDYIKRLGQSGIKLYFIHCNLPWGDDPQLTPSSLERELHRLRRQVPDAKVMLRINLNPPASWIENHPDELFRCEDGSFLRANYMSCFYSWKGMKVFSLVSEKWLKDAAAELKKMLSLVNKMPDGELVMGYFICAGKTSEWIQLGGAADYGSAFQKWFARWLRKKYSSLHNLREAWRQPDIEFATVRVPSEQRLKGFDPSVFGGLCENVKNDIDHAVGMFVNPDKAQDILDLYEAYREGCIESIEHFGKVVKEFSGNNLLVGAFHGELVNFGLSELLANSNNIDFLANPNTYVNQRPGELAAMRCITDSYKLHNKIYMVENDTRSYLAPEIVKKYYFTHSKKDTLEQMKGYFGRNLCLNLYGWWFDMYDPQAISRVAVNEERTSSVSEDERGSWWYDAPEILNLIRQQQKVAKSSLNIDCNRDISDIAVIFDERSTLLSPSTRDRTFMWRATILSRLGCNCDYFYLNDLASPAMRDYKMYIFANTFSVPSAQRAMIHEKLSRNGATALWMYASGIVNPDSKLKFNPNHIKQLTGIKVKHNKHIMESAFHIYDSNHPVIKGVNSDIAQGRLAYDIYCNTQRYAVPAQKENYQSPTFTPVNGNAIGHFDFNGSTALACCEYAGFRSIFCAAQFMHDDLVRAIARNAGCHIVCSSGDFISMNKAYLSICASTNGEKEITLPEKCSPVEVYSNQKIGTNIQSFTFIMKKGETKTFSLNSTPKL